jgi:hypothetical protein
MKLSIRFIISAFIAIVVYLPAAHGQANLTFSGGNNVPLSITLQQPVAYTITDSAAPRPVRFSSSTRSAIVFRAAVRPSPKRSRISSIAERRSLFCSSARASPLPT